MAEQKVAIIQNRIHKGGRLQVILALVRILNERGVVPDIITFESQIPQSEMSNRLVARTCVGYDLVINSSNTSLFLSGETRLLSYVHFPRKKRVLSPLRSIHLPGGPEKRFFRPADIPSLLSRIWYRKRDMLPARESLVANSEFTREMILESYPCLEKEQIGVVFPPVPMEETDSLPANKERTTVVSLGRFSKEKKQLEQIKIATQLPGYTFIIAGFAKPGSTYLKRCRSFINEGRVTNVKLCPNLPYNELKTVLNSAAFFLHSMRNEPFGITSVQAAAAGCLPVVHDSGGQREVVPLAELRYTTADEAVAIFRSLREKSFSEQKKMAELVRTHVRRFNSRVFEEQMTGILSRELKVVSHEHR